MRDRDSLILENLYFNILLNESKESIEAELNAKTIFGSDDEPFVRGYIYSDGSFLNLRDGQDHREINSAYYPDEEEYPDLKEVKIKKKDLGSSEHMIHFMSEAGAIRWGRYSGNHLIMSYVKKPTHAQKRAITKIIDIYNIETVSVDVYSPSYQTIKSVEGDVWDDDVQKLI
jgi:hypothetical protein